MKLRTTILAASLALGVGMAGTAGAAVTVLAPNASVEGRTIGQWTENWIQWAVAQPSPGDAFSDPTGAAAGQLQSSPVFHVAGIAGTMNNIPQTRSFTVPWNSYILVPLLNSWCATSMDGPGYKACAESAIPLVTSLHAVIDGVEVPDLFSHLENTSDPFSFVAAANNIFGFPAGPSGDAYGTGYYIMLAPIGLGSHVISFGGNFADGSFIVDVTANITGVPEPATLSILGVALMGLAAAARRKSTVRAAAA